MQNASENALINQLENMKLQELLAGQTLNLSMIKLEINRRLYDIEREKNHNKVSRDLFGALLTLGLVVLIFSSVIISFGFFLLGVPLFILFATATIAGGVGLFKTNKMAEEIEKNMEKISSQIQDISSQIQDMERQINAIELSMKNASAEEPVNHSAFPSLGRQPQIIRREELHPESELTEVEPDEIDTNRFEV